jgi:hypothetical protein
MITRKRCSKTMKRFIAILEKILIKNIKALFNNLQSKKIIKT